MTECIVCKESTCDKLQDPDKGYCCWCVPSKYIKKTVKEFMCNTCKQFPE